MNSATDNRTLIKRAVLSGTLIGIGDVVNLLSENRYIGAMLFSFALLSIIQNGLPLFTGKIGFIQEVPVPDLLKMLVFNLAGSVVPFFAAAACKTGFFDTAAKVSDNKFSLEFWQLFLMGVFCGVLMLIAVYSKREIITVFCIMVFILSGFEHCIADFPFLVVDFDFFRLLGFLCIVLGNSVGAIAAYYLMSNSGR